MTDATRMVVFDLYGTLIQFGVQQHPYRTILTWARENGRKPRPDDARLLMTTDGSPEQAFELLDIYPPEKLIRQFRINVARELDSLVLFDDVIPTLSRLSQAGLRLAVCSNLAKPYGAAIDGLLPQFDLLRCLSYQAGFIKPEPEIYEWLLESSGLTKESIIFVGDNKIADYEGPSGFGFNAFHLVRGAKSDAQTIGTIAEIAEYIS